MPSLWLQPLRKYADFTGRATRSEYWGFTLVNILLMVAAMVAAAILDNAIPILGGVLAGGVTVALSLYYLAIIIPSFAVCFRRLHDIGRSAWWILIGVIPVLGGLVLLVFLILDGTVGQNPFGPDPKGRDPTDGGKAAQLSGLPPKGAHEPIVS